MIIQNCLGTAGEDPRFFAVILEEVCLIPLPCSRAHRELMLQEYSRYSLKRLAEVSGMSVEELLEKVQRYAGYHRHSKKEREDIREVVGTYGFSRLPVLPPYSFVGGGFCGHILVCNHDGSCDYGSGKEFLCVEPCYSPQDIGAWISQLQVQKKAGERGGGNISFWLCLENSQAALSAALFLRNAGFVAYYLK